MKVCKKENGYEICQLKGSLRDVRNNLKNIPLEDRFIIFALDYGLGKTTFIEDKIISRNLAEGNFFSRRHDRIEETIEKFKNQKFTNYQHFYGFAYTKGGKALGCPDFFTNSQIGHYYNDGISPTSICNLVCSSHKQSSCVYKNQFNSNKAWQFAPHEFLGLGLKNFEKKKLNVIDEDTTAFDEKKYDFNALGWSVFTQYTGKTCSSYLDLYNSKFDLWNAIGEAEKNKSIEDLKKLIEINNYRRAISNFYGGSAPRIKGTIFYLPRINHIFNILRKEDTQVILLDGGFNIDLFKHFRDNYKFKIPDPIIYTSNLKNKKTKVIQVNPNHSYSRGSKEDRRWDYDLSYISDPSILIMALERQGKKVGIITVREVENEFKSGNIVTAHYGDTSGSNVFVGCDALILLGEYHYGYKSLGELYWKIFGTELRKETDSQLREKRKEIVYKIMEAPSIEAGFRIRPLEYAVDIYFFRKVTKTFIEKFSYEKKNIDNLISELEPDGNYSFNTIYFSKNTAKVSSAKDLNELAKALGIRSNDYNTVLPWFVNKGFVTYRNGNKFKIKKKK